MNNKMIVQLKEAINKTIRFLVFSSLLTALFFASAFFFMFLLWFCSDFGIPAIIVGTTSFVGFILGAISIVKLCFKNLSEKKLGYVIVLLSSILLFLSYCSIWLNHDRSQRSKTTFGLFIANVIIDYAEAHDGYLPNPEIWCDLLLAHDKRLSKEVFRFATSRVDCDFALNSNLRDKNLKDLPIGTVLIFHSKGNWNLNGGEDMFIKTESKKKKVFIYNKTDSEIDISIINAKSDKYESVIWE